MSELNTLLLTVGVIGGLGLLIVLGAFLEYWFEAGFGRGWYPWGSQCTSELEDRRCVLRSGHKGWHTQDHNLCWGDSHATTEEFLEHDH